MNPIEIPNKQIKVNFKRSRAIKITRTHPKIGITIPSEANATSKNTYSGYKSIVIKKYQGTSPTKIGMSTA